MTLLSVMSVFKNEYKDTLATVIPRGSDGDLNMFDAKLRGSESDKPVLIFGKYLIRSLL